MCEPSATSSHSLQASADATPCSHRSSAEALAPSRWLSLAASQGTKGQARAKTDLKVECCSTGLRALGTRLL